MPLTDKIPKSKADLIPKKHHGFQFFIFLCGCLLPPIAVAVRFGVMSHDFWINVFLCICGYFPCHFHNFYIQNIRNNTNRARTPKWALKAGLIDTRDRDRRAKKNQWAKRFDERNNESTHVGQALEDGEEGTDYVPVSDAERERQARATREGLWEEGDAEYYNEDQAPNQQHWSYPMNFNGAVAEGGSKDRRSAKASAAVGNGDRWERSRASRSDSFSSGADRHQAPAAQNDVPEWGKDYGSKRKSKKDKKVKIGGGSHANGNSNGHATVGKGGWASNGGFVDEGVQDDGWGGSNGNANGHSSGGAGYGDGRRAPAKQTSGRSDDVFNHEF